LKTLRLLPIIFSLTFSPLFAQNEAKVDKWIDEFTATEVDSQKALFPKLISPLLQCDTSFQRKELEKVVQLTSNYTSRNGAEVAGYALLYLAFNGAPDKKLAILKKAYRIADEYDLYLLMGSLKANMSDAFKEKNNYDSAMVYLLQARTFIEKAEDKYEQAAIIHRIGDFYFYANLLDKAEASYKEVLELKGDPASWKTFRYVVINNNLGEIENKRNNFNKGEKYFQKSLNHIFTYTGGKFLRDDSVRIAYTCLQLAITKYLQKDFPSSESFYEKSQLLCEKIKLNDYLISLYTLKGNLYYAKAKYDSALYYLDKASALDTENSSMNATTEIYRAYADVYEKKKDYKNAFLWLQKFERSNDTISHRINAAAYLQIKAEKDNEASLDKIKSLEREKYFLIGIAIIISMSFAVILMILIRLRNADKKLINKSIEIMKIEGQYHVHPGIHEENLDRSDEQLPGDVETENINVIVEDKTPKIHFVQLISQLEKLMSEEQLYLNPEISLDEIATKLESNRTYLSKAINQVYSTNFTSYLNDLRIKDSIRIISQKESARFSIEGIAKEVGFNNRITFISAFKKYTGVTPSFFIKNLNVK